MKRGKVSPRNRERKAAAFARNYGEESGALRLLPCIVASRGNGKHRCSPGPIEVAHVVARGMGGAKGGRFDIVPMCSRAHRNGGEARGTMREAFELQFGVDLRAEADALALLHERPLGVRGLVDQWVLAAAELDAYELDALRGWVTREMAREVGRRRRRPKGAAAGGWPDVDDNSDDNDREALAHHIAHLLGGDFTEDPHGEHGLAWSLCEWAGWPS